MGQLDNASVTDRETSAPGPRSDAGVGTRPPLPSAAAPVPAGSRDEPQGRLGIALVGLVTAAAATAVVVVLTSGGDEPSTTRRAYDPVRTPAVTAPATTSPVVPPPAAPTAAVGTTTAGTQVPGTASAPGAGSPAANPVLPAGWEPRTFQGVTFAVPPGATGPDLVDPGSADAPALFSWNGPSLGGEVFSHVSMWIYPADDAPTVGPEYQAIPVPGADQARMWTGPTGSEPASITVDVHVLAGSRFINLVATVAPGAAGEQTVRDLVASLAVG